MGIVGKRAYEQVELCLSVHYMYLYGLVILHQSITGKGIPCSSLQEVASKQNRGTTSSRCCYRNRRQLLVETKLAAQSWVSRHCQDPPANLKSQSAFANEIF
jgi:hypothetical protein